MDLRSGVRSGTVYVISATGYHGELGPTVFLIIIAAEQPAGMPLVPQSDILLVLLSLRPAP